MTPDIALPVFVVLGAAAVLVARFAFRTWASPVTVYFGVWISIVVLQAMPFLGIRPLLPETWNAVFVAATTFTAGSFYVWLMVLARNRGVIVPPSPLHQDIDDRRLMRWFVIGLVALYAWAGLQAVILLPATRAAGGFGAIFSNGLSVHRAQYAATVAAATTGFSGGSLSRAVLGYLLWLGAVTLFWAPLVARRGHRVLALAPLLPLAAVSFLTLSREPLIYAAVLMGFSTMYYSRLREPGLAKHRVSKITVVAVAILVVVMIYVPLKLRQPDISPLGTVRSVAIYTTGGVAALNEQIRQTGYDPSEGVARHGTWTFWGEATILSRLGLHMQLPPVNMPYVNFSRYTSFTDVNNNSLTTSNVYTYLIYFINDFGFVGLLVGPFLLGAAGTALDGWVRSGRTLAIPAAATLMASIFMSFFGLSLIRDTRYIFLAIAAVFLERLIRRRHEAAGPNQGVSVA